MGDHSIPKGFSLSVDMMLVMDYWTEGEAEGSDCMQSHLASSFDDRCTWIEREEMTLNPPISQSHQPQKQ